MPARLRCCCYSIAIAWMTIIVASYALVPSEDRRSLVIEKNRRTIGSLFATNTRAENNDRVGRRRRALRNSSRFFLDGITTTVSSKYLASGSNAEAKKKSLLRMSSPEIFQDPDSLLDSDSNAPHVRVKRIANSINTPARPSGKSSVSHIDHRRTPQKIYKRFAIEETNPADENEAEHSTYDEGNIDVPGNAFLDDEISRKRNHLEDVYPEVTDLPRIEDSRAKRSNVANKRKTDQLYTNEYNEEEYDDVDCVDDDDSYYDDKMEDRQTGIRSDNYEEEEEEREQKMNKHTSASKSSEARSDIKSTRLSESLGKSEAIDEEEQLAALKGKPSSSSTSSKKSYKNTQTKEKTKPKKKPSNSKDDKKKSANSSKDKIKYESKPSTSKTKPKRPDKKKDKKRAKPMSKSKNLKMVESNVPEIKKGTTESIANVNGDDKCTEEDEDNVVEEMDDKERLKRNKSILIKAVPRGDSVRELQIFQRADNSKKKTNKNDKKSTVTPNKGQSETTLGKSDKYIGEVKDLLDKLIVKVDGLHNLVSEMKSAKDN